MPAAGRPAPTVLHGFTLDDYHIQGTSFMIDRGDDTAVVSPPDIDVDGAPRINGVHVDIGADEI